MRDVPNNSEASTDPIYHKPQACDKWDLLIQTVRHEKIRPSAVANTEKHINMTNERPRPKGD